MKTFSRLFGRSLALGLTAFIAASGLVGCLAKPQGSIVGYSLLTQSNSQAQTNSPDGPFDVIPANGAFNVAGTATVTANLASSGDANYTITAGNYSGKVSLSVEYDEVKDADTGKQIALTITPTVVTLAPGASVPFKVHSVIGSMAPDLAIHYHVLAREYSGSLRKETEMETTFAVLPVVEISINAGNALNAVLWSADLVSVTTGVGTKQPILLAKHLGGVTVRFINNDPIAHIVHGSGAIPHQNTKTLIKQVGLTLTPPAGSTFVDSYEVKVTSTASNAAGTYYSHDKESGAKAGMITFNSTANPVPVGTTTGDPTATFTLVNNQILKPLCLSCHTAGAPSGGVDVSTYAAVVKTIVIGDASVSNLYTAVLNDSMPTVGAPLTATQKEMLKRWISTGALNN